MSLFKKMPKGFLAEARTLELLVTHKNTMNDNSMNIKTNNGCKVLRLMVVIAFAMKTFSSMLNTNMSYIKPLYYH